MGHGIGFPQLNWRASGTTSDPIELAGQTIVGFFTPGTFASTSVTFMVCDTIDGTYVTLKAAGGGSSLSFTVTTSGYYGFTGDQIAALRGIKYLKMVGGSSEAANTVVKLACRELA